MNCVVSALQKQKEFLETKLGFDKDNDPMTLAQLKSISSIPVKQHKTVCLCLHPTQITTFTTQILANSKRIAELEAQWYGALSTFQRASNDLEAKYLENNGCIEKLNIERQRQFVAQKAQFVMSLMKNMTPELSATLVRKERRVGETK